MDGSAQARHDRRALLYSHDTFGLGHLRRSRTITTALTEADPHLSALIVTGSPIAGRFDVVMSNPPYIATAEVAGLAPEVARYEPVGALDGGHDGLDAYRALLPITFQLLAPGGVALFEMGAGQHQAICSLARACGFEIAGLAADLAGFPRVAILRQP